MEVLMRKAPTQSRGDIVERVMSVLNLGLQGVALAKEEMSDEMERSSRSATGWAKSSRLRRPMREKSMGLMLSLLMRVHMRNWGIDSCLMQQEETDCDEELLSMLMQGNPHDKE